MCMYIYIYTCMISTRIHKCGMYANMRFTTNTNHLTFTSTYYANMIHNYIHEKREMRWGGGWKFVRWS